VRVVSGGEPLVQPALGNHTRERDHRKWPRPPHAKQPEREQRTGSDEHPLPVRRFFGDKVMSGRSQSSPHRSE